jgi:predicted ATP-dependent endonuclease of OLD family
LKKEFTDPENKISYKKCGEDITDSRINIFNNAMKHLEDYVLSTKNFEDKVKAIKNTLKKQLNIDNNSVDLKFGFPSYESFFDSMEFYLSDTEDKPKLPINNFGSGFVALFVIAIFQVLSEADEGGKIYIIEEPETFLHEHYQEYFYKVLCDLAKKNQVIYTTHSKKFVDIFDTKTIIKVSNPDFKKSQILQDLILDNFDKEIEIRDNSDNEENPPLKLEFPNEYGKYVSTIDPNINNIIFANKVIIVEGTHDKLIYKSILDRDEVISGGFGLNNIAIVTGQGKSSIEVLIKICKSFDIKFFVIHDWDLPLEAKFDNLDLSNKQEVQSLYNSLSSDEPFKSFKTQITNNKKIFDLLINKSFIHHNKPKIEASLNFEKSDPSDNNNLKYKGKSTEKAYSKILNNGKIKTLDEIQKEFPNLLPERLLNFLKNIP